jgi:DNA repair protein RecO (recombination protein O)
MALAGLSAAAAVLSGALPEREPNPGAYLAMEAFLASLEATDLWPAVLVRFEAGLLEALGFGLSLGQCAVTGSTDNLLWISPRTGRAVCGVAGEPYRDRLFALPPFMISSQQTVAPGDVGDGLTITGHFLTTCVFAALSRPLPPARARLIERLGAAGRL